MCNAQGKRLGDFIAGSIVVRENSPTETAHSWSTTPATTTPLLGAHTLTPEEITLIETFLARRHDLAPPVRLHMAQEILGRLALKLTLTEDNRTRVETTLESLTHEHRARSRY